MLTVFTTSSRWLRMSGSWRPVQLLTADVALDGLVGQQLGEVACENPLALSLHGCA
jgi:hypothetical protein